MFGLGLLDALYTGVIFVAGWMACRKVREWAMRGSASLEPSVVPVEDDRLAQAILRVYLTSTAMEDLGEDAPVAQAIARRDEVIGLLPDSVVFDERALYHTSMVVAAEEVRRLRDEVAELRGETPASVAERLAGEADMDLDLTRLTTTQKGS
jgi:hypothetical protein